MDVGVSVALRLTAVSVMLIHVLCKQGLSDGENIEVKYIPTDYVEDGCP